MSSERTLTAFIALLVLALIVGIIGGIMARSSNASFAHENCAATDLYIMINGGTKLQQVLDCTGVEMP